MRLVNVSAGQSYEKAEWVVRKGDQRNGLSIAVDGEGRTVAANDEIVDLCRGDCFGKTAFARGGEFQTQVRAITKLKVLHISRESFDDITRRYPRLGRRLFSNFLVHLSSQLDTLQTTTSSLHDTGI